MSCVTWEPKSTMRILSCSASCPEAAPDAGEESRSVISKLCAGRARSGQGRWSALSVKQRGENPVPGARLPPGLRGQRRAPVVDALVEGGGLAEALAAMRRGFVARGLAGTQSPRRFPILAGGGGLRFALGALFLGLDRWGLRLGRGQPPAV